MIVYILNYRQHTPKEREIERERERESERERETIMHARVTN
jgi:hypothetical protein